jgi:nucleoside phosphorylase
MPVVDYLILTPLDEEFQILRATWPLKLEEVQVGRLHYYRAHHTTPNGEALVVVTSMGAMGQAWSGVFASEALRVWEPLNVIQLGIAGSIVGTQLALGDVIVPAQVVGYEIGDAVETDGNVYYRFRPTGSQTDFALLGSARALCNDSDDYQGWQERAYHSSAHELSLTNDHRRPSVHIGEKEVLASGNFVVKSKRFAEQLLQQIHPKLRAVEMEAKGLFDAVRLAANLPAALVVRGVSDQAGPDKEAVDEHTGGVFRRVAVRSATQFVVDLIERRLRRESAGEPKLHTLRLTPRLARGGPIAARDHGLETKGQNSACVVFDPLLDRSSGTPSLKLTITIVGEVEPTADVQVALRQRQDGWTRLLNPTMRGSGTWTWIIDRSAEPYLLSFALVASVLINGLEILVKDEFGRETQTTHLARAAGG